MKTDKKYNKVSNIITYAFLACAIVGFGSYFVLDGAYTDIVVPSVILVFLFIITVMADKVASKILNKKQVKRQYLKAIAK